MLWEIIYRAGGKLYQYERTRPLAWRIARLYARNEAGDVVFERIKTRRRPEPGDEVLYNHLFKKALAEYVKKYFVERETENATCK